MSDERRCPKCGTALSGDALAGLCRKCLGRLAFADGFNGADPEPRPASARQQWFGDYELIEEIARGGMGVVYKARQTSLDRVVAVKMILHGPFSSEEFLQRFRTEAQAAARLHHPNIVPIYEVGLRDGQHYFSMEYIEGKNLADVVREQPLAARRAAGYVKAIAEAMHYAHQQGILHRDLKPSNVLLDIFDQPRITDFGLAKLISSDSQLTVTGQALGSPGHMPPEQAAGKHAAASPLGDIYSLGAILYHLVTARPPFQGETLSEVLLQVQSTDPVAPRRLNPSVPVDLQTICLKCLQKDPARRYSSALALAADLARFLERQPILARPLSPVQKLWLWCRRRPVPAALTAGLLVAVLLGLGGVLWEWRRAERHAEGEARERRTAESSAAKVRLNLYAADINLASQAVKGEDYGLARRTLAALQPKDGEQDLRGFEWRYLANLCRGDERATLTGHTWIVTCVAFSPDGRLLVSGSQDGTAKVWDAAHGALITTLDGTNGSVWSIAFSPEGDLLMTAGHLGVRLWNTANWRVVGAFPGQMAALSKQGALLAVSESSPFAWEAAGPVSLWDYRTGSKLAELAGGGRTLAFSPDARTLAVAGRVKGVSLYDVATKTLRRELKTDQSVWTISFSPDGDRLLTAGWTSEALVWDLAEAQPPTRLRGHLRTVWSAMFAPEGRTILTTSSDQTIRLWDAVTLRSKNVLRGHDSEVWCAAYSPDGELLASGGKDQTVRLWRAEPRVRPPDWPHTDGFRPAFSPDGRRLVLMAPAGAGRRPQLWDLKDRSFIADLHGQDSVGFSPGGDRFVTLDEQGGNLEFWTPGQNEPALIELSGVEAGHLSAEKRGFSPDWKELFVIDHEGQIRVWRTETGRLLGSTRGPRPPIRSAVLGPGGTHLAVSLERENIVRLFDTATGQHRQLAAHRDFVSGLAFSPDGATLATGSMDGTLRLWVVASGQEKATLPGHVEEVTDVAFSPDGRTLASLGHKDALKLWHLATLRELLTVHLPDAGVMMQFSPDGQHLAVTTENHSVRLFDAP